MKFVFIAKLAGGIAMRSNGRIPVGLPCLAEPIAQRQIPNRRDGRPAGQGKLPCQRPDLRRTARLERPFGRRRRMWSAPDRAADAPAGLAGEAKARRRLPKDAGDHQVANVPANLLDRQFVAERPNQKWIADFTYIWTAEGWLYVSAVIDLFSRRVVGWSMSASMTAQLVADA